MITVSTDGTASPDGDVDRYRHAVGEHVVHGRPGAGTLDQIAQHVIRCVALDLEADPDPLVAVPDLVGQAEDAEQVDVTLDGGLHRTQRDTPGRGDVGDASGQTGGDRMQQELNGRRSVAGPDQYGRVIGLVREVRGAGGVLLSGAVEAADRAAVMRTVDPPVGGAELELRELRVRLDGVKRCEQGRRVYPVQRRTGSAGCHRKSPSVRVTRCDPATLDGWPSPRVPSPFPRCAL